MEHSIDVYFLKSYTSEAQNYAKSPLKSGLWAPLDLKSKTKIKKGHAPCYLNSLLLYGA